jgi:stalled ribosome rescue protein Dom34
MSEKNKKQFGVWMDNHQATIVGRKNIESGDFILISHVKNPETANHSNENAANNSQRTLLNKFFKEISSHMQNVEELHITGTGTIQEQFKKYLDETPQFKNAKVQDSTTNKMDDEKFIKLITEKFH